MAAHTIEFVGSARKEFERLPVTVRSRIAEALRLLAENPYSELLQMKKLKDANDLFRLRIGDYRVVYELNKKELVVVVIKIGNRKDVYRR